MVPFTGVFEHFPECTYEAIYVSLFPLQPAGPGFVCSWYGVIVGRLTGAALAVSCEDTEVCGHPDLSIDSYRFVGQSSRKYFLHTYKPNS